MGNDQKRPPPTHSTHTAIISPGLNMAAVSGQTCFSGQGLPAVQACHIIKFAGCSGPPATKSLSAVQACHPTKSTGCAGLSPHIHHSPKSTGCARACHPPKSTGCTGPATKVYRLYIYVIQQSLLAVQAYYQSFPADVYPPPPPPTKAYWLCKPATTHPPSTPAVQICHPAKSTGRADVLPPVCQLCRPATHQVYRTQTTQQSLPAVQAYHLSSLPAVHTHVIPQSLEAVHTRHPPKSTGRAQLPPTKVYRPYTAATQQSLLAVQQTIQQSLPANTHPLLTKVYWLYKPVTKVYRLYTYVIQRSLLAVQACHQSFPADVYPPPTKVYRLCARMPSTKVYSLY